MSDEDIKAMPIQERINRFHAEYKELAAKWGCDFLSILRSDNNSIRAEIAVRDLWEKKAQPGKLDTLPN